MQDFPISGDELLDFREWQSDTGLVFNARDQHFYLTFVESGEAVSVKIKENIVPDSVLEAIKMGVWDFEPNGKAQAQYYSTEAMPGTGEKLSILARRVRSGLPLWHPNDRQTFNDSDEE